MGVMGRWARPQWWRQHREPSTSTSQAYRSHEPAVSAIRALLAHSWERASSGRDGVNALRYIRPAAKLPSMISGTLVRGRERRDTRRTWSRQGRGHKASGSRYEGQRKWRRGWPAGSVSAGCPAWSKGKIPPHARPLGTREATRIVRAHARLWQSTGLCRFAACQNALSWFTPRGDVMEGVKELLMRQAFEHHTHHTSDISGPHWWQGEIRSLCLAGNSGRSRQ